RVNWSPLSGNSGVSAANPARPGRAAGAAAAYRPVSAAASVAAFLSTAATVALPAAGHFRALIVRPQPQRPANAIPLRRPMCCDYFSCLPAKLYYRSVLPNHGTIIMKKILTALLLATGLPVTHADDDYTRELYELYCQACLGAPVSGAPRSFGRERPPWLKNGLPLL